MRSFRHFLAKMTPPSRREANISPVTAGTKALHNQKHPDIRTKSPISYSDNTDGAEKLRLELFKGVFEGFAGLRSKPSRPRREGWPQIAFFRTFFSKKKVHWETAFSESHRTFLWKEKKAKEASIVVLCRRFITCICGCHIVGEGSPLPSSCLYRFAIRHTPSSRRRLIGLRVCDLRVLPLSPQKAGSFLFILLAYLCIIWYNKSRVA